MKNNIIKGLSILSIVLFGFFMASCGKKAGESEETERFEYRADLVEFNLTEEDAYISASDFDGEYLKAIVSKTLVEDEKVVGIENRLHRIDVITGEDKAFDWTLDIPMNSYAQGICEKEDGTIAVLCSTYSEVGMETMYSVVTYSTEGKKLKEISLADVLSDGSLPYISQFAVSGKEDMYIAGADTVIGLTSDGKKRFSIKSDGYINAIFLDLNDNLYISGFDNATGEYSTRKVDIENGRAGEKIKGFPGNGEYVKSFDGNDYVLSSTGVYVLDAEKETAEHLFSWLDVDMNEVMTANDVCVRADGTIVVFIEKWTGSNVKYEFAKIKKELVGVTDEKIVLELGCLQLMDDTKEIILDFNKHNDKYRINVTEYAGEEGSVYESKMARFNADVQSGKFDMVYADSDMLGTWIKDGAFEDLNPYIDKDLNRDDYFNNVFEAFENDGKLYFVSDTFFVYAMMCKKSVLEDTDSWTISDMIELRNKYPDKSFFAYPTKEAVLSEYLYNCVNDYIDFENGTCRLNSDEFKTLLEFANSFELEINDEEYDEWSAIRSGNVLFETLFLCSCDEVSLYSQLFGDEVEFVGFPGVFGAKTILYMENAFAISKDSKCKEGAWELIKSVLQNRKTSDHGYYFGMPMRKAAFDDMIKAATSEETYIDENGKVQGVSRATYGNGSVTVSVGAISESTAERFRHMIENAHDAGQSDMTVFQIISEETGAYFHGEKSVDEIADIIQSRVSIYLAESR